MICGIFLIVNVTRCGEAKLRENIDLNITCGVFQFSVFLMTYSIYVI